MWAKHLERPGSPGARLILGRAMEKITLLFEESRFREGKPSLEVMAEWVTLMTRDDFGKAVFNLDEFLDGKPLRCQKAPKRDTPAILRCHPISEESYKRLYGELLHFGYHLMNDSWTAFLLRFNRHCRGLRTDGYFIESVNAGASFGSDGREGVPPSIYVVRDDDGVLPGAGAESLVVGWKKGAETKAIAEDFARKKDGGPVGEVFFEKYVPIAGSSMPVVWRAFYFDGKPFFIAPAQKDAAFYIGRGEFPEPPQDIIDAFTDATSSPFYACDFALAEAGGWKCVRCLDGQMTLAPYGGDLDEFYNKLAEAVAKAPVLPEWIWCLTARVRDENRIGEDHRLVHGTRHFAPGTKVYLHPPNWDERVAAIGVPRYSDKRTCVVVDVRKLEEFALEKVFDKEIITAIKYKSGAWFFNRFADVHVGRGSWDDSDESKSEIEDCIEWLSALDPNGKRWS